MIFARLKRLWKLSEPLEYTRSKPTPRPAIIVKPDVDLSTVLKKDI